MDIKFMLVWRKKQEKEIPANFTEYPFTGCIFMVQFDKSLDTNNPTNFKDRECIFQEVSGLNIPLDIEVEKKAGENKFVHKIPARAKYENLVLKRGMFRFRNRAIIKWAEDSIFRSSFTPIELKIILMDEKMNPLASWVVTGAYPVSFKVSEIKNMERNIVIETLELAFDYFMRIN